MRRFLEAREELAAWGRIMKRLEGSRQWKQKDMLARVSVQWLCTHD